MKKISFKNIFYLFIFIMPFIFVLLAKCKIDNDLWGMLAEGRYIFENGIYRIDPFTIHNGLNVAMQNWGSALLFFTIYKFIGEYGLLLLVLLCAFIITFLTYKICMLISDNHKILSLIISFLSITNLGCYYLVCRSQIISFISLLLVIYLLELYIKTKDYKKLIFIPIISLFQVNYHSSLWLFIFLFSIPYILDGIKLPLFKTERYKVKPILLFLLLAFAVGFINPYGYKAITFIFGSFSNPVMHDLINELHPFTITDPMGIHMFCITLIIVLLCLFNKEGKIKIRYVCLFCGTLLLGLMSFKGFSEFLLICFIPLANYFKDIFPRIDDIDKLDNKFIYTMFLIIDIILILFTIFLLVISFNKYKLKNDADEALNFLNKHSNIETVRLYNSFNNGGYLEFYGYKTYIDPKAEVFLKSNNGKKDILEEYSNLQEDKIDAKKFIESYNFTHLFLTKDDELYFRISKIKDLDYFIIYSDEYVTIYAKNDYYSEEEKNSFNKYSIERIKI